MTPENFIPKYQSALASQDWTNIEPLISSTARITFSDGNVHVGKDEIRKAYEKNFKAIKNEKYSIDHVKWIRKEDTYAVYLFEYNWSGPINDKLVSGSGVGTAVLITKNEQWILLTEHLGRKSNIKN